METSSQVRGCVKIIIEVSNLVKSVNIIDHRDGNWMIGMYGTEDWVRPNTYIFLALHLHNVRIYYKEGWGRDEEASLAV